MTAAIRLEQVTKIHRPKGDRGGAPALDDVSLTVPRGAFLAVMGRSGSGKSTLLHCAAGLDAPTRGRVWIGDTEIGRLRETARTRLRRERVGFVFQAYNLIPSLTLEENITLPLRLAETPGDETWLGAIVDRVGLGDFLSRKPGELSGGQQQRVAVARALATRPDVVFADEPTGALDPATGDQILSLLDDLVRDLGQTVVMVTHDPSAAARAHDVVVMEGGRIVQVLHSPDAPLLTAVLGGRAR
ncbi:putative ABC transport system ATP-binding protein [Rhodococcus sp. SMB37]|uniref:ABC transporter ATP-binding protein n=1 Tax=Rhodococcus sp. SMB37 TaxID=2512213 RepID=UPI0010510FCB|nr:ABC transporter ATP-binding protein [Rhodococcus sp. SMB37]TCN55078.1 putative ABC transport system ATP-binding protein [Rhodococcus sp. SMB37]